MKKLFPLLLVPVALIGIAATYTITQLTANLNPGNSTLIEVYDPAATPKSGKVLLTNYVRQSQIDTSAEVQEILGQVYQATNATLTDLSGATPTINGDLNVTGTLTNAITQTDTLYLSSLTETNKLLGLGATTNAMVATAGMVTNTLGIALTANALIGSIGITIDGGGSAITTGIKGDVFVPYACTINSVTMLADTAGDAVVDIWVDSYANYPPDNGDSITADAVPTITAGNAKSQDTTLTGWDTAIAAGDTIRFNVDSATTITRLTLVLKVTK